MLAKGLGNAFAAFNVDCGGFNRLFHNDVSDGLGNDLHDLENRQTGADQGSERAGKARETNLMGNDAEDGQFDAPGIPELPPDWGLDEVNPGVNSTAAGDDQEDEVAFDKTTEVDQRQGGPGKLSAKAGKDFAENRDNFDQEENGDEDGYNRHDDRIHHRGFDLFAQPVGIFQVGGQAGENFGEQAAFFAGCNHANVKSIENLGMFLEGFGKTVATLDARADVFNDVAHD